MSDCYEKGFFEPKLMEKIREKFFYTDSCPFTGERIFLDSASGSLRLKTMVEMVKEEAALPDNFGRDNLASKHAEEVMEKAEEDVRVFLGAKSGEILSALSSTHAIFSIVESVIGNVSGTNVVTTNLEHPSVYDSTRYFSKKHGKEWRVACASKDNGSVSNEEVLSKIDKNTCLLALIHGSNITGAVLDVEEIIKQAKLINENIYVLVDGVQFAPHGPVDVESLLTDAYVFGGYKTFCKKGISFAYLSDRLACLPHWKLIGKPENDWELGSKDNASFAAWSACFDYLCWLGSQFTSSSNTREQVTMAMNKIKEHTSALLYRLLYGSDNNKGLLAMKHINLYGIDKDISNRICLIGFNIEGKDSSQGVELYSNEKIRIHNRISDAYSKHVLQSFGVDELIRLSTCHYNTAEEIDYFLQVTAKLTY